jgi:endonuclease/exonuclease/phosphatase family metal-dependent hydrolase
MAFRSSDRARAAGVLLVAALALGGLTGCSSPSSTPENPSEEPEAGPEADVFPNHPARIAIDGRSGDWSSVPVRYDDPAGDGDGLDLETVQIAHNDRYVFLRFSVGRAVNLQEGNDLTLYVDADARASTGRSIRGLGAEASYTFGDRSGQAYGTTGSVGHAALGLYSLPTVRDSVFEVAFDRSARPLGEDGLFAGDSIRIALAGGGDQAPDAPGGMGYRLGPADVEPVDPIRVAPAGDGLRLMSQNAVHNFDTGRGSFFDPDRREPYARILQAVGPDVVGLQEIYEATGDSTARRLADLMGGSATWHGAKAGQDLVAVSRYPILQTHAVPGYQDYESGAFLIDADDALGTDLVFVVAHPPCCNSDNGSEPSDNAQRQRVVDGIVAFLRDLQRGEGPFDVPDGTPIAVVGDMNFVGDAQQERTLRAGRIVNTDRFGEPAAPDWDGTELLDARPRHTARPLHVTWVDPGSSFPPGRLDYAYVTDSVLEIAHEFVLSTSTMPAAALDRAGLEAGDTPSASDHLPVVIDVRRK